MDGGRAALRGKISGKDRAQIPIVTLLNNSAFAFGGGTVIPDCSMRCLTGTEAE